jgi:hypothetical protein
MTVTHALLSLRLHATTVGRLRERSTRQLLDVLRAVARRRRLAPGPSLDDVVVGVAGRIWRQLCEPTPTILRPLASSERFAWLLTVELEALPTEHPDVVTADRILTQSLATTLARFAHDARRFVSRGCPGGPLDLESNDVAADSLAVAAVEARASLSGMHRAAIAGLSAERAARLDTTLLEMLALERGDLEMNALVDVELLDERSGGEGQADQRASVARNAIQQRHSRLRRRLRVADEHVIT